MVSLAVRLNRLRPDVLEPEKQSTGVVYFDMHRQIERYITPGKSYECTLITKANPAIGSWENVWPYQNSNGWEFHRWFGYAVFVNLASANSIYYQPDGTAAPWSEVVAMKFGQKPQRPILGDQITWSPWYLGWRSAHTYRLGDTYVPELPPVQAGYIFGDGHGKEQIGEQDRIFKLSENAPGSWAQWWSVSN